MSKSKSTVKATVLIDNKEIEWPFRELELVQKAFDHHEAAVTVALDIPDQEEKKKFVALDDFQSALGKSLTIKIEPADEYVSVGEVLEFVGTVYHVSFENDVERINRVTFHAFSPTKFMDHEKINHVWHEQKLDSTVKGIIGKYSQVEQGEIKMTSDEVPYLVQFKETDWKFLCRLFSRESIWLYYNGRKLVGSTAKSTDTHTLNWEKNIGSFDLKMKIDHLEHRTEVYWEGAKEQQFSDSTKGSSSTDFSKLTRQAHQVSKSTFKGKSAQIFPQHAQATSEVTKYMVNQSQAQIGGLVHAEVQSNMPSIKIGDTVKIEGMKDFCGTYFVTEITHNISEGNDYSNEFTAAPLETAHPEWKAPATEMPQLQVAEVIDNVDPDNRYRVKVKLNYTDENDQQLETPWLRVLTDHAGDNHGSYWLPEIGDEVLVGFERDNPEVPVVLGALWNGTDTPDAAYPEDNDNYKAIYTKGGNKIEISDEDGKQYIKFTNSDKNLMYFECDGPKITMHTDGDIAIDAKKNISVKAGGDYSLEATNISVKASNNITVEAGAEIKETATANIKMKGANVKIEADSTIHNKSMGFKAEASMGAEVKCGGSSVCLTPAAIFIVGGPLVNINSGSGPPVAPVM
ncbi:MAG: phage baseplate assembly protein V, partial [bacterium]